MVAVARDRVTDARALGPMRLLSRATRWTRRGRFVVSTLAILAGVVHLALAGPHFEEATWLGAVFLVDGFALCGAGVWLLLSATRQSKRAAGVIAALTALAYLASRTIGLPGMEREAWDSFGLLTTIAELIVVPWPFLEMSRPRAASASSPTANGRRDA